ncbi:MAG TPA: solute carrier family 23 protein [Acetobacteraceae bacterium]|nr:solute carrier family 23 protein [Acetobacteraceae bacterium]
MSSKLANGAGFAKLGTLMTPAGRIAKKPATLSYGLEETPPAVVTAVGAVQHVGVSAIFMIYPLIIAHEVGLPADRLTNLLQLGLLVLAIAALLQALPRGPVGSRLLAPSIFTGVYLAPSLLAAKAGGMPLVWGMTMFAGVVEMALSRAWSRLRPFIPPESAGLVVFLVGCIIGLAALRVLLEDQPGGMLDGRDCIVAGCALAVMAALNIWSRGWPKLFCILIGMVVGYLVAGAVGLLGMDEVADLLHRPLFAAPSLADVSWRFEWSLAVPFAVTGVAAAMNTTAVVTTYQRLTDAEWVRPDMTSIGRGVLGDGIATTIAGLLGTYGVTVSSANVGLVAATGVASRVISFAVAALLALAALQPTLIGVLTIMPRPVMAAAMLFTSVFIMISGVQIISTRVLDGRRTLVVGMGIIAFFVDSVYPMAFAGAPWWAQPLVTSPLVLATLVALSLNLLFRIGIRRTVTATVDADAPYVQQVSDLIERQAGVWGARRDVTSRVEFAMQQTIEAVIAFCNAHGVIRLEVSYDEFVIQAVVAYVGIPLVFPTHAPTRDEILEADDGQQRLAGFLVRRYADSVTTTARDSLNSVRLRFDH